MDFVATWVGVGRKECCDGYRDGLRPARGCGGYWGKRRTQRVIRWLQGYNEDRHGAEVTTGAA